tara:strand:- start:99716 stop:100465 length:750 start_codon:yes stop_codon:yes gene_type:complete
MKKILLILMAFLSVVSFSQNSEKFEKGKTHYKEANYEAAISAWESILESGEHSAALYYNLGNAYFKAEQIAPSIYYYEKALQLAPADSEIKNNLAIAQSRTIDAIEPAPENFFSSWLNKISNIFTFDSWAWITVFFVLSFTVLFLLYYYSSVSSKKRLLFTLSFIALFFAFTSFSFAFLTYDKVENERTAIIFAQSTQVRSEPLDRSEVSFVLHEGTKVTITEEDDDWSRILLSDGKEGWILRNDLKEL